MYQSLYDLISPHAIPGRINGLFLLLLFLVPVQQALAQSRQELEDRRRELLQSIEETREALSATKRDRALTMDMLLELQEQIELRQEVIATLQKEIRQVNDSIARVEREREVLQKEKDKLVREYATMLRAAYRLRVNQSILQFLFSSSDLNEAFRRWQYLRQYDRYRRKQAGLILTMQERLEAKNLQFEAQRKEKEGLLAKDTEQRDRLRAQVEEKNQVLQTLELSEAQLLAEMKEYRATEKKLQEAIAAVIREEMERRRAEANDDSDAAAEARRAEALAALTGSFEENKGRLPWPVVQGKVVRAFGQQPHPTIKNIKITNNGIDIETRPRSDVFSVFEGTIAGSQFIPGYQNMIIVQHGQFYTVYSNLAELYVERGDAVSSGTVIGRLNEEKPTLHFEVWREKERLNPVYWIN